MTVPLCTSFLFAGLLLLCFSDFISFAFALLDFSLRSDMAEYSTLRDETSPAVDLDYCLERVLRSGYRVTRDVVNSQPAGGPSHLPHVTSTPSREFDPAASHAYASDRFHPTCFPREIPVVDRLPAEPPERPPLPHFFSSFPHQRIPQVSYFSGESGKGEVEFEVWKYEVGCLVRSGMYMDSVVLEAVRKSLKGKARLVLLHLGEWATIREIINEMEGIYGNVCSVEKLKEKFYSAGQKEGETVVDYSFRLEQLLCSSKIDLDRGARDEMLRSRLWSGLRSQELKNVSRFKYETVRDYAQFRKELRQIEQDLNVGKELEKVRRTEDVKGKESSVEKTPAAYQHAIQVDSTSKILRQLEELTREMRKLGTRMDTVEKELKGQKGKKDWREDRPRQNVAEGKKENTEKKDLNRKGPSPQGQ